MKLKQLRALPPADQRTFLLGRIAGETTRMDAALRLFNAALHGERDLDALLDAPDFFTQNLAECQKLLAQQSQIGDDAKGSLHRTLTASGNSYAQRNRYIHDLLRTTLVDHQWELTRMSRRPSASLAVQLTSLDEMVRLVRELVACTWRLRGGAVYLSTGGWKGLALGHVVGKWNGDADYQR